MRSSIAPLGVGEHFLVAQRFLGFGEEKVDAPGQAVQFVARLAGSACRLSARERLGQQVLALDQQRAELLQTARTLLDRNGRPLGLCGTRQFVFRADGLERVGGNFGQDGAGGGIHDLHRGLAYRANAADLCRAAVERKSSRIGVSSMNVVSPGGWNSGATARRKRKTDPASAALRRCGPVRTTPRRPGQRPSSLTA
jgi:hypothetical protein